MTDKCKETVWRDKVPGQCSHNAKKNGWCKKHWKHPYWAVWSNKVDESLDDLPKCTCKWGYVVSPAISENSPDGEDELIPGWCSLSCVDCRTSTGDMPIASDADVKALGDAWRALIAAQVASSNG